MTDQEWRTTIRFRAICRCIFDAALNVRQVGIEDRITRWLSRLGGGGSQARPPTARKLLLLIAGCGRTVWQDTQREERCVWVERTERFADSVETAADQTALTLCGRGGLLASAA